MVLCPDGHKSAATDYCDICGASLDGISSLAATSAPEASTCPACGTAITGRFCEACGQDSALPPPPDTPAVSPEDAQQPPPTWTALITADRTFYERVLAQGGPDSVEFPDYYPERSIALRRVTNLIGRRNRAQGIEPEIDLAIHPEDRGVSTQHAVLRVRYTGLTITDLGSTNGTSLNDSDDVLGNGEEVPLGDGDRIHVGAWTTITVRQV
ncbi:FHA domain-containing protein [Mycolicibacterium sp. BiH015]|uniref:FHA domain-containing protein n=1 Tax=Mycolicibacterium sp. BiH015 TaxID=3018808 RepID=UPI0022DF394F|nr:FHA domain-containing protein [Mycolicibacterium sp. BiH015]MDA2891167.1 FHA domain-containing protein [Mycolicibacterium sp. BiH015]